MRADLADLEARLGYTFADRNHLVRALTHKSYTAIPDPDEPVPGDNEQLEFLGDAVLGFLISDLLVARFPDLPEGRLSKLKAQLVSASHLYVVASRLGIGEFLRLGRGEELSGGRSKKALSANALEAVLAAIYLDRGMEPCRSFVEKTLVGDLDLDHLDQNAGPIDYKSALQEIAQSRKLPIPRYVIVKEEGPEHAKTFTVEARVGRDFVEAGVGTSKKAAAQKAAAEVLRRLSSTGESSESEF